MNKKAFLLAMFAVIVWGSGFAAIRASLLGGYTPGHLVLTRFLIASSRVYRFCFVARYRVSTT